MKIVERVETVETMETVETVETMETVETAEKAETVETNIPYHTILKNTILMYSKEFFHMKVINIFNCQHVGVSMIKC